jgi:hypothetical protein
MRGNEKRNNGSDKKDHYKTYYNKSENPHERTNRLVNNKDHSHLKTQMAKA